MKDGDIFYQSRKNCQEYSIGIIIIRFITMNFVFA